MRTKTAAALVVLAFCMGCDSAGEAVAGPGLVLQAVNAGETTARAVTGSGHYTSSAGFWRTFSFQVRRQADGSVRGRFQLVGHRQPAVRLHGSLTCFSVLGNEAWIGGIYEKATNQNLIGTGFGFYVKDNGQGSGADPDLMHRHVRGQGPEDWCSTMWDVSDSPYLFPIESGNVEIHTK
jgi:hypothetical protein